MLRTRTLAQLVTLVVIVALAGLPVTAALAATSPTLGAAETFSVLAALSMSAAGPGTTVSGDLGLSPGLAVSRTGPWTVGGSQYFGPSSLAFNAQADALAAFNNLAGQASNGPWAASPWSPAPGVWTTASDTTFAGTITLNGGYDDVWVFQVGRDMTFSGSVIMAGNAQPCHVFWQIGRDATIAVGSTFVGTLIASRDVTLVSGATVDGRIMSLYGALTTDGNTITGPSCALAPTLIVKKTVINDNGGTLKAEDFTFSVNGGAAVAFEADGQNDLTVNAGTYNVTEPAVAGYATTYNNCSNVVVPNGGSATCTITNNDVALPGTLIVKKTVINDNGGTLKAEDFTFSVNGGAAVTFEADGQNDLTVNAGTYNVTEPAVAGYATTYNNCSNVVVPNGSSATCTITNNDVTLRGTLIVKKTVINDSGGTLRAEDFTFSVNGGAAVAFEADGQNDLTVNAGTYNVTEPAVAGYATTYNNCSNVVVPNGGSATCTITNNDVALPGLSLTKSANPTVYSAAGQVIVYTYIVKNTGNVSLGGPFNITDDKLGTFQCGTAMSLAPGATVTCTKSYTIQASDVTANVGTLPTGLSAKGTFGSWLQGSNSTQNITLSGLSSTSGIPNGIYAGWCIQDHITGNLDQVAKLYSSIGSGLPADVSSLPWNKINYVLNHKIRGAGKTNLQFFQDVQTAIWLLLGEPNPDWGVSAQAQQMVNAANANPTYVPGNGDIVAVIVYADGMGTANPNSVQESIIEMTMRWITNKATATAKLGADTVTSNLVQATINQVMPTAKTTPTTVTCRMFVNGTGGHLTDELYTILSGKVKTVSPNGFLYYSQITAPASSFTIDVGQTNSQGWKVIGIASGGIGLYDKNCAKTSSTGTFNAATGKSTIQVTGATAGAVYYVRIQYNASSLVGQAVSMPKPTVPYTFLTYINSNVILTSQDSVNVKPK